MKNKNVGKNNKDKTEEDKVNEAKAAGGNLSTNKSNWTATEPSLESGEERPMEPFDK